MIVRVLGAAGAALLMLAAAPASAQQFSDSYNFLNAIRETDGTKVNKYLENKSLRIVNAKDRSTGEGALHIVTRRSDSTYLRVLLQQDDINPNLQDNRGNTPLIIAAERGWGDGVQILLKYGANVNTANTSGETPLIRAVQVHDIDVARQLLAAGANPDRTDNVTGKSARDYARDETRYPQIAKLLAEAPKGGKSSGSAAPAGPKL
ncbi:MAG: ankyrin repeat domain-containing protein [Sphingomonas sp.]|uniref:ankyrin repeat domain-containing protein n=1 Tax=unclassified Sphingomonas TaxID=196159 RepID=UPI00245398B4|nr:MULTISPECIES: ankyrin repeat domain-containing protein [unclassified Sphingomonas]MBQ1497852.1 ankyrin repeat domain-containing protein [Sphingomonas sp.]MDH4742423.1 ankyrin repeat domain-containing protein [Sphingomonas sp. CBMAI 2297]